MFSLSWVSIGGFVKCRVGNPSWCCHIGVSPCWLYSVSASLGCVDLATDIISIIRRDREGLFCGSRVRSSVEGHFSCFLSLLQHFLTKLGLSPPSYWLNIFIVSTRGKRWRTPSTSSTSSFAFALHATVFFLIFCLVHLWKFVWNVKKIYIYKPVAKWSFWKTIFKSKFSSSSNLNKNYKIRNFANWNEILG